MEFYTWAHMDFAILMIVWHWFGRTIELKPSELILDSDSASKFVFFVYGRGNASGKIVARRFDPITVQSKKVRHLILTAGHAIGIKLGNLNPNLQFSVMLSPDCFRGPCYKGRVLHDFSSWDKGFLLDSENFYNYPLENDLELLAIEDCDQTDLVQIPIADTVIKGEKAFVVGYLQEPQEIIYSALILRDYDMNECKERIYRAFHGFGK
jgi:hypothetical protein